VGIAMDDEELAQLKLLAESIKEKLEQEERPSLFSPEQMDHLDQKTLDEVNKNVITDADYEVDLRDLEEEARVVKGIHDVYGTLFENFNCGSIIKNPKRHQSAIEIFKQVVLARIANPKSKRATVDFLEENFGVQLNLDRVYRMMDLLDETAIKKLNDLMYKHTATLFEGKVDVIFFDCTTIYFESFQEDEFRRNGYSKDLKFNQPQVLIALMVTKDGLPVGYEAFSGDTYEGHALIPAIKDLKEKHRLDKVVYVADAGLLNEDNLRELETLEKNELEYIVGARLRSLPDALKKEVLNAENYSEAESGDRIGRFQYKGRNLIVTYSPKRARKDAADRKKAVEKLIQKLKKKKNPKEYLSNYGNKKYIKVSGESHLELNEEKVASEVCWDGLHGMVSNSKTLTDNEITNQYRNLWQVEESFRVTKHDLKVRPVFHWKEARVKAHLAISFAAFSLVRHLEYRVKLQYKKLSPEKIRQHLINVQTSVLFCKKKKIRYALPSAISQDAKKIYQALGVKRSATPYIIEKM